jgi:UDP:flavonoid glycosyltransferase YjiC (YdhE family)
MEFVTTSPIKLCYYITGHGYGHATRSLKMVEGLTQQEFDVHIVSTSQTIAFIRSTLTPDVLAKITTHERMLDAGNFTQTTQLIRVSVFQIILIAPMYSCRSSSKRCPHY